MTIRLSILSVLLAGAVHAQNNAANVADIVPFQRGTYMATVSAGFINSYRSGYTVPSGFEKGIATGFAPVYARFEYALSNRVSIAAATAFNTITFNSYNLDNGYSGPIKRTSTNRWRLLSGGIIAYYHFGHILHSHRLDPFIGGGLYLNNILESASPVGDSTVEKKSHSATPTLKIGARYYISPKFSVFADAGYDKISVFSLGMSCRFFAAKKDVKMPASSPN